MASLSKFVGKVPSPGNFAFSLNQGSNFASLSLKPRNLESPFRSSINCGKSWMFPAPLAKSSSRWMLPAYAEISENIPETESVPKAEGTEDVQLVGVKYVGEDARIFMYRTREELAVQAAENGSVIANGTVIPDKPVVAVEEGEDVASVGPHDTVESGTREYPDLWVETKGYTSDNDACIAPDSGNGSAVEVCPLVLDIGVAAITHPARVQTGSEDAYFVEGGWIGLADGISSWADLGVNSGMYAREMMWHCLETLRFSEDPGSSLKTVIIESHEKIELQGSCTVLLAAFDGTVLKVANIGDSGLLLIREGSTLFKTKRMIHGFNDPLSIGAHGPDDPEETEEYEFHLQPKDILLLGSDGLFDNVFEREIAESLVKAVEGGKSPEAAAKILAQTAHRSSVSSSGSTPFSEAAREVGKTHEGGKKDDITVVVAYVY